MSDFSFAEKIYAPVSVSNKLISSKFKHAVVFFFYKTIDCLDVLNFRQKQDIISL